MTKREAVLARFAARNRYVAALEAKYGPDVVVPVSPRRLSGVNVVRRGC